MPGIDLGTSNSAIAFIDKGQPRVIKPDMISEVMPSVVYIDKRGGLSVGNTARMRMLTLEESEGTGHDRWKPRLGQDDRYHFAAAKQTKSGPELSALVIRELLNAYAHETGEQASSCVITIPAKFDQPANDATREAAKLAGLTYATTVKEPIAAALAYGFSNNENHANWMVFDLGGGTLDVCLMAVRDGELTVLQNGQAGDQYLGGSYFDRILLDFVLGPVSTDRLKLDRYNKLQSSYAPLRKQYKLDDLSQKSNPIAWHRLLLAVEEAKIELSRKEEAEVHMDDLLCKDAQGNPVRVDVKVTRKAYESLISELVERAVTICQMLLSKNRMSSGDLDQLILVGGPTKTPYLQEVLADRLKMDLNVRLDPMTAVALGAALHAETMELPTAHVPVPQTLAGNIELQLQYQKSSPQPSCALAGIVTGPNLSAGYSLQITRNDGNWSSTRLPIDETGFFETQLLLIERGAPHQSLFTTRVFNAQGVEVAKVDEPRIWHPMPTAKGTLTNSIGIAITGNETIALLEQGQSLPARAKAHVQLAKAVRKGSADDMLRIPVIEAVTNTLGEEDCRHADAHLKIGELTVAGNHQRITMDLAKGTDIELSIDIDASQKIKVKAYVERLDDEFEAQLEIKPEVPPSDQLDIRFYHEKKRLGEVRTLHQKQPTPAATAALAAIDRENAVASIETGLEQIKAGETSESTRVYKRILELAGTINHCWEEQTHPRLIDRISRIRKGATGDQARDAEALQKAVQSAGPEANQADLAKLESEVQDLDMKVRFAPFYTLLLYYLAIAGKRVSQELYTVHSGAGEYVTALIERGAPDTLTSDELAEIERWNQKLRNACSDLQKYLEEYQRDNQNAGSMLDSFGTTVTRRN